MRKWLVVWGGGAGVFEIVLGILAGATLVAQILRCGATMSQIETTLFGMLQFVFSIAFGWLIARGASKREFEQSQKKFAISAYRRIREIEQGVDGILGRIRTRKQECEEAVVQELYVLQELAQRIRATVVSSTSDWADIIGDEIATVEEMERVRREQSSYLETMCQVVSRPPHGKRVQIDEVQRHLQESLKALDRLTTKLPLSLRVSEREQEEGGRIAKATLRLWREISEHGSLVLGGFWDADSLLDKDIRECDPSGEFKVVQEPGRGGGGLLMLYTESGHSVGRMTNHLALSYDGFAKAICTIAGHTFVVKLEKIEQPREGSKRVYFTVRYVRQAKDDSTKPEE
jgi:hypothetical protein